MEGQGELELPVTFGLPNWLHFVCRKLAGKVANGEHATWDIHKCELAAMCPNYDHVTAGALRAGILRIRCNYHLFSIIATLVTESMVGKRGLPVEDKD